MGTRSKQAVWPLGPAASLVLLKGLSKQGGEAMKLTFLELATLGKLVIKSDPAEPRRFGRGAKSADATAWVPAGATAPGSLAAASVFEAAKRVSSQKNPSTVIEIAHAARWVDGDWRASSVNGWLTRFPLKELYNKDLMYTRKRFPLPSVAALTDQGRAAKDELKLRLESLEQMPGMDKGMAAETLHLAGTSFLLVESSWPTIDVFVSTIDQQQRAAVGDGAGGGGGDGGDGSFDFPDLDLGNLFGDLDLGNLDLGGFDLGGLDFGGGGRRWRGEEMAGGGGS